MSANESTRSILGRFLDVASNFLSQGLERFDPRNRIRYEIFEVTDRVMISQLCDWYIRHQDAKDRVTQFLNDHINSRVGHLGGFYGIGNCVVDDKGRISKLAYTGNNGFRIPDGWKAKYAEFGSLADEQGAFMVPENSDIQKLLNELPNIPTRRELHDIIGWPTFPEMDLTESLVNTLVCAHSDGERTYVHVPAADNFVKHPQIHEALQDWFENARPNGLKNDQENDLETRIETERGYNL